MDNQQKKHVTAVVMGSGAERSRASGRGARGAVFVRWPGRASPVRKHLRGSPQEVRKVTMQGSAQGAFQALAHVGGSKEQPGGHCGRRRGVGQGRRRHTGVSPPKVRTSLGGAVRSRSTKHTVTSPRSQERGKVRTAGRSAQGAHTLPSLHQLENVNRRQSSLGAKCSPLIVSCHPPHRPTCGPHEAGVVISPILQMRNGRSKGLGRPPKVVSLQAAEPDVRNPRGPDAPSFPPARLRPGCPPHPEHPLACGTAQRKVQTRTCLTHQLRLSPSLLHHLSAPAAPCSQAHAPQLRRVNILWALP